MNTTTSLENGFRCVFVRTIQQRFNNDSILYYILLVYNMTIQLSPADFATGGQPQMFQSSSFGSASPTNFSSNLVGGRRHRTYKRFMRGKKSYKKRVHKRLSSSPGMFSKLMNTIKGTVSSKSKSKRNRRRAH